MEPQLSPIRSWFPKGYDPEYPAIPAPLRARWRTMANLLARLGGAPYGVITRVHPTQLEILVASEAVDNPYKEGLRADLNTGMCCETVMDQNTKVLVANALQEEQWVTNPGVALGLVSYLGLPLAWPDGAIFGTICVLDKKANQFSADSEQLLQTLKESVEADLTLLMEFDAKEQLISQLSRMSAVLETTSDYVAIANLQGQHSYINPAGLSMLGYTGVSPSTLSIAAMLAPEEVERHLNIIIPFVKKNRIWSGETALRHRDGHAIPVSMVVTSVCSESGEPLGVSAMARDISDVKRHEAVLFAAKEAAEAASLAKSTFLANMSHELRTPLNAISGFAQLLCRDSTLSPQQQGHVSTIERSSKHLLRLINDVLEVSKVEAGSAVLTTGVFSLSSMLDDLEKMLSLKARSKGLRLEFDQEGTPAKICTDEIKLRQVLINLITNAIKFTERGHIKLSIRCEDSASLRFTVEDTGVGINEDSIHSIFEPFQRGEMSEQQEGTGLGLRICQGYVQLMGGELSVESTPKKGSRFSFSIHVEVDDQDTFEETLEMRPMPSSLTTKPKVLIADDHTDSRQLLVTLMEQLDLEVRAVEDGAAAVQVFGEWRPDLIWMDMRMPVMDGRQATRQIKARPGGEQTVIIAITASAFEEERAEILEAGCNDFVRKPYLTSEIYRQLERYLGLEFEQTRKAQSPSDQLTPADLAVLPEPLLQKIHAAATEADADALMALLPKIYQERLQEGLRLLMADFRFDVIMQLSEGSR